jgi:hypothetical protein
VSFTQVDKIRRAPAHLRQTLMDRAVQDGLPSTEIRKLIADARAEEHTGRAAQCEQLVTNSAPTLQAVLDILLAHEIVGQADGRACSRLRKAIDRLLV